MHDAHGGALVATAFDIAAEREESFLDKTRQRLTSDVDIRQAACSNDRKAARTARGGKNAAATCENMTTSLWSHTSLLASRVYHQLTEQMSTLQQHGWVNYTIETKWLPARCAGAARRARRGHCSQKAKKEQFRTGLLKHAVPILSRQI